MKNFLWILLIITSFAIWAIPFDVKAAEALCQVTLKDGSLAQINNEYDITDTGNLGTGIYVFERLNGLEVRRYPLTCEIKQVIDILCANNRNNIASIIAFRLLDHLVYLKNKEIRERARHAFDALSNEENKH